MKVRTLSSVELKQFLEYVEVEAENICAIDCSPDSPEECLASAALLILKDWLPKQIKTMEHIEQDESSN